MELPNETGTRIDHSMGTAPRRVHTHWRSATILLAVVLAGMLVVDGVRMSGLSFQAV